MNIQINNQPLSLPDDAFLTDSLVSYGAALSLYAIAINSEFVPRAQQYSVRALKQGDCIDVIKPVAGG
ncbi:sulfur carrier protein ThiS [Candidatus Vallotia lariciata]|uniref:sulfur carrier protein ThiS n=1 Tax=Candidatus Vallotia laricis TaxID=2018052 RepID=UPI001D018960|nr:sulfur carrier protein ThiS [Candidatus Vallotia lariciata]UDG82758.1 sulfur carrier protein ThiS [Candidatus Vallotia lariciata]